MRKAKTIAAMREKPATSPGVDKFQAPDDLNSEVAIREFLAAAMEDPNPDVFLAAPGEVAKARGIADLAARSGLGRESLYKTLSPGAKPRHETICKLIDALGVKLSVKAA